MKIKVYHNNGREYIINVDDDARGERWDTVWAPERIKQAGRDGFFEVEKNVFIPMHNISYFILSE
jgi:hypothetical protein